MKIFPAKKDLVKLVTDILILGLSINALNLSATYNATEIDQRFNRASTPQEKVELNKHLYKRRQDALKGYCLIPYLTYAKEKLGYYDIPEHLPK